MRRNDPFVLNPTLQIAATAEVSRRHRGRRVIEVTEPRTVKYLLSVVTGRMGRVDAALRCCTTSRCSSSWDVSSRLSCDR